MKLYRASDSPEAGQGHSFSPDIEVAEAYLDSPGFGGDTVYEYEIDVDDEKMLDLYDEQRDLDRLAEEIFEEAASVFERRGLSDVDEVVEWWRGRGFHDAWSVLFNEAYAEKSLCTAGYEWVSFRDNFPNVHPPPETWLKLSKGKIEGTPVFSREDLETRTLKKRLLR